LGDDRLGPPAAFVARQAAPGVRAGLERGGEYACGDVHTNTVESVFSLLKRGITGILHAVSKKHLPRYVNEFDFRWNNRTMNDGQRTAKAIREATGKR
jgi:hypothetical protein